MEYALRTFNLIKVYKNQTVLNSLNMTISKGDIYGFVGENGSGKTTLIRTVCGLIFPKYGEFELFGIKNTSKEILEARKKIGAIVEEPSVYKNFTALDNILMQAKIVGITYTKEQAKEILELVGLGYLYDDKKKAGNFSLGMRQRLGIAMALVGNKEFLILDEPMNGLDPAGIVELRELIIKLNQEKNITFLISSHILSELQLVATKYGIISKGRMIKEITSEELAEELKTTITINVTNPEKAKEVLLSIINEENISCNNDGIIIPSDVSIDDVTKLLVNNEIGILGVTKNVPSIEEYYMKTIGGNRNA
ncbi:MAG: ATP-binding cassette domain-containing protein [Acholeplasmatales bacterium]|nr:ATP-binding cassette domain-containing protein [Acholeplasmatales bacterium]